MLEKEDLFELRKLVRRNLGQINKFNIEEDYQKIDFSHDCFPVYVYENLIGKDRTFYSDLLRDLDEIIIKDEEISIAFDYPLSKEITLNFKNRDGFKRIDLLRCTLEGFEKVYNDSEEGVADYETRSLDELSVEQVWYNSKAKIVRIIVGL